MPGTALSILCAVCHLRIRMSASVGPALPPHPGLGVAGPAPSWLIHHSPAGQAFPWFQPANACQPGGLCCFSPSLGHQLAQGFLTSELLPFAAGKFLIVGAVLCIAGGNAVLIEAYYFSWHSLEEYKVNNLFFPFNINAGSWKLKSLRTFGSRSENL